MTAALFLLPGDAGAAWVPGAVLALTGEEGRHAADVARVRTGEQILIGDGAGVLAHATVDTVARGRIDARVQRVATHARREPELVLVQALAKGDRDLMAVESATELGVDAILPWQAARSVSVWSGAAKRERGREKWRARAVAAAKQSRRPWVPVVEGLHTTPDLVGAVAAADLALVLHEAATTPIGAVELPERGRVVLVVGPEGGIADQELADLTAAGARSVRLGPEVLRTSTAGPAAVAAISARHRW